MEIKLNLLSEAKKKEVRSKKRYRLIVWQEILATSLLLFYVGILLGISYMINFQLKNEESAHIPKGQEQVFQEINSTEKKFQDVNQKVADTLNFQREHIVWSNVFIALDKVILDGILLDKMITVNQTISLSGKANTRDILLQFQDNLNASDCFQNAKVPLSNLFTQKDVDFQLDVDIKTNCLKPGNL